MIAGNVIATSRYRRERDPPGERKKFRLLLQGTSRIVYRKGGQTSLLTKGLAGAAVMRALQLFWLSSIADRGLAPLRMAPRRKLCDVCLRERKEECNHCLCIGCVAAHESRCPR